MNIIKFIQNRFHHFQIEHFSTTPYGLKIKKLHNIHSGRRCFIIGNGPSLTANDLDILAQHEEITFAFNRIYYIFKQTSWRPTYYMSQDDKMLANCWQEALKVQAKEKFIPIQMKWYFNIPIHGVSFYNQRTEDEIHPSFSEDISVYIGNGATVVYTAIQFAVYMGIKEIYLIGVDHHFHTSKTADGKIVIDPNAKDYFSKEYNNDKEKLPIPNTELSTFTFIAAKEYADAHGIKIFNATRGGKLEVYPRVNFDELFK